MQTDRGLQACIGVVLAFSLLWTIAIMIPDDRGRSVVRVRSNSNRLSVDNNKKLTNDNKNLYGGGSQASSTSRNLSSANQVSSNQATQQYSYRATNQSSSSTVSNNNDRSISSSSTTTNEKKKAPLFPRWAWFGMFIVFHAQRFVKKVRKRHFSSSQPYTGEGFYHHKSGSLDDQKFLYDTSGLNSYYGGLEYEDDTSTKYGSTSQTNWSGDAMDKFDMCDILSQSSDDLLNTSLDDSDLDDLLEL